MDSYPTFRVLRNGILSAVVILRFWMMRLESRFRYFCGSGHCDECLILGDSGTRRPNCMIFGINQTGIRKVRDGDGRGEGGRTAPTIKKVSYSRILHSSLNSNAGGFDLGGGWPRFVTVGTTEGSHETKRVRVSKNPRNQGTKQKLAAI